MAEPGFAFLEVDTVAMEGRPPVTLYALMGNAASRASPKFRAMSAFPRPYFTGDPQAELADGAELIAPVPPAVGREPGAL